MRLFRTSKPPTTTSARATFGGTALKLALTVLVVGGATVGFVKLRGPNLDDTAEQAKGAAETLRWVVKRDDLTLSALSPGVLRTKSTTQVINEVEKQLKIVWIIDEGTRVQKGDKLIQLDAADLNDQLLKQKVRMADVGQQVQKALDDLAISESKAKTDLIAAENQLRIAELDLKKYKEGDYIQSKRKCESAVAIAEEELKRAKVKLDWTRKLAEKGYVTQTELEGDEFAVKNSAIKLDAAKEDLNLLQQFTFERETTRLSTSLVEAGGSLERIKLSSERDLSTKHSMVEAAKSTLAFEEVNTKNLEGQIAKTTILAPVDGMVVYYKERWRDGNQGMVIGTTVSPRQRLIDLPDFSSWIIEARVHESMIQQIRRGQSAFVTLDAFPDSVMEGKVERISVLPDNSQWYRDTQEYLVNIDVSVNRPNFKPGMSAKSEIILGERSGVLTVPLQAVSTQEGHTVVRLLAEGGPIWQDVEVGANNDRFVEIVSGLTEGQTVLMEQLVGAGSGLGPRPAERASPEQRKQAGGAAERGDRAEQQALVSGGAEAGEKRLKSARTGEGAESPPTEETGLGLIRSPGASAPTGNRAPGLGIPGTDRPGSAERREPRRRRGDDAEVRLKNEPGSSQRAEKSREEINTRPESVK